jgi:hypothetical protein
MKTEAVARCWWCGESIVVDELFHLEGARLLGSPPLALPERIGRRERLELRVCGPCAIGFAEARKRHEVELAEGALYPGGTAGLSRTVETVVRDFLSPERGTEGRRAD